MKKLFVVLFVMLFAGMMTAQAVTNVSETEQDGNGNDVLVKQIGDLNEAESHQYGNQNDASVLQTGDNNEGIADQLNGDRNSADLVQTGNLNEGYVTQGMIPGYYSVNTYNQISYDNKGVMEQVGDGNYGELLQTGNSNDGKVAQNGNNNTAVAYTGWAGAFYNNGQNDGQIARLNSNNSTAIIEQIHDGNFGGIWQYGGNNNEAHISQDGNGNSSSIVQGFIYSDFAYDFTYPIYNTKNNYASVDQLGNSNYGKVMQLGDNNTFKLNQTGNGNLVGYNPNSTGSTLDRRNEYFHQDGSNNSFAGVVLDANNTAYFAAGLDAEQINGATLRYESNQKGDYNKIGLRQGQDDLGLIQQDGISNTALLFQGGVDQNQATMMQTGNSNSAEVVQIQQ